MTNITIYRTDYYDRGNCTVRYTLAPPKINSFDTIAECDGGKQYALPDGYELAESISGELAIYDDQNRYCPLITYGQVPAIIADQPYPLPLRRLTDADDQSPIKYYLSQRGMTQQGLASRSGIHINQIQRLASGDASPENITLKTALALSDVLGIHPAELISKGSG